jgi:hypothetical protein
MSLDLQSGDDVAERRLQRLEHRFRRAQNALAGARAIYGALREMPSAKAHQLQHALLQVQQAQQYLVDLQHAIELAETQEHVA